MNVDDWRTKQLKDQKINLSKNRKYFMVEEEHF